MSIKLIEQFCQQQELTLSDNHTLQAQGDIEPHTDMISLLRQYAFLIIEGPDAATFLQGQTTCNIDEINSAASKPGALCTAKGKVISNFHLCRIEEQCFLMRLPRELVAATQKHLAKYIVFSKAEILSTEEQYVAIGLSGSGAGPNILTCFGQKPVEQFAVSGNEYGQALQLDEEGMLFECWLKSEHLSDCWEQLSRSLTLQGSSSWQLLNIRRGWADLSLATSEEFFPQMLHYPQWGAVSFKKGCYTGQEVVARMHYKAKPKRGLYRVRVEKGGGVSAGTPLYQADSSQGIGNIVSLVALSNDNAEALAVIAHTAVESETLHILSPEEDSKTLPVEVLSLPYAIT